MGQTAFSRSAARVLVGQLSRSTVSTITAPQAVTQVSVLKPEDDHKPTGVQRIKQRKNREQWKAFRTEKHKPSNLLEGLPHGATYTHPREANR